MRGTKPKCETKIPRIVLETFLKNRVPPSELKRENRESFSMRVFGENGEIKAKVKRITDNLVKLIKKDYQESLKKQVDKKQFVNSQVKGRFIVKEMPKNEYSLHRMVQNNLSQLGLKLVLSYLISTPPIPFSLLSFFPVGRPDIIGEDKNHKLWVVELKYTRPKMRDFSKLVSYIEGVKEITKSKTKGILMAPRFSCLIILASKEYPAIELVKWVCPRKSKKLKGE